MKKAAPKVSRPYYGVEAQRRERLKAFQSGYEMGVRHGRKELIDKLHELLKIPYETEEN